MPTEKNNSGVLWKNSYKEHDKHPDYKGDAIVDGKPKRLSAWIKTKADGEKFLSLSIEEPYLKPDQVPTIVQKRGDDTEEIPF